MLGMCQLKQKRDSPETPGNAPAFRRRCSSLSRFPDQVHSEEDGHRQQEPEQLLVSGDLEIGQWLFLVPFIGGRFHLYTTYILPIGWLYATYQLLSFSYWIGGHPLKSRYTPWKINMEPENDGLEEEFSFSIGWFLGSMLIFRGVPSLKLTARKNSWKFHGWKRILPGEGMLYQNFRISPFDPDSLKWITSWTLNINLCRASIVQFFEGKTISLRKDVIIDSFFKRQHLLGLCKSYCITTRSKQTPWITLWMIFRGKNNATWIPIKVVHCGSKMASLIHQKISFSNCFYSPLDESPWTVERSNVDHLLMNHLLMNHLLMNNLNQQDQLGCINMFWVEATVFLKSISGPIRCEVWGSVLVSKIRGLLDIWKTRLVLIREQYWSPSEGIVSPSKCSVWSHHLVSHNDCNVTTQVTCEAQKDVGNTCMLQFYLQNLQLPHVFPKNK